MVRGFELRIGLCLGFFFSPSVSARPPLVLSLSLKIIKLYFILSYYFKIFLMFIFERERETEREQGRVREGEGDTESETGSRLRAVSIEPDAGLDLTDREIVT